MEKEQTIRSGRIVAERTIATMKYVTSIQAEPLKDDNFVTTKLEEELALLIRSCNNPIDSNSYNEVDVAQARKILSGLNDLGYKIVS